MPEFWLTFANLRVKICQHQGGGLAIKSNAEIVKEAMDVVWTEGRADRVADYNAEDFVADYPMTDWGTGLDGVRALVNSVRIGLPDYRESIETLVDGGAYRR